MKIRERDFLSSLYGCDIVFFLETWLRLSQEDSLPLPKGFLFIAQSRPDDIVFAHQWGGVAVLYRDDIPLSVVQGVSAPDLLVLDLDFCFLIASYLPPRTSNWLAWTAIDPEQRLQEALAYCAASRDKMMLLLGDLNARTASNNSLYSRSPRFSADNISDSRGNRLLLWCTMYRLSILNGTSAERDSPGALTCRGASVVDYVAASVDHPWWIEDRALVVEHSSWSDHCMVSVTLTIPTDSFCPVRSGALRPPVPPTTVELSLLDNLADIAIQAAGHHSADTLYGMATVRNEARSVYVSFASSGIGGANAKAVFGSFWGPNHCGNEVLRVPGEQTDSRASIAAVVRVLQTTSCSQRLHIYSTSKYAIRTFVYWVPGYSARGWACKNADLLQLGVYLLQQRTAEVEFRWFSPISPNGHATAAQALVRTALTNRFLQFWVLPVYPPPQFRNNSLLVLPIADLPEFPKVWSNLKPEIPAGHRKQFLVKESDLRVVSHQGAHRGPWPLTGADPTG